MALSRVAPALLLAFCALTATVNASFERPGRKLLESDGSPIYPRMDMAEIDAMDELEPYRVMMLLAWQELEQSSGTQSIYSYWRLAGIHGKTWAYNGVNSPTSGFCRHQNPHFGPWHRAYLKQFEDALIAAAQNVASRFTSTRAQSEFGSVAEAIRLPYWDWTNPRVPDILQATRVTVVDEEGNSITVRNPFGAYEFVDAAGDGRGPGRRIRRGTRWAETMSNSARRFGMEMASFVRSSNWRCSYLTGGGCIGNLESTHNEIHNVLGGTAGEMATVPYAGFDPLFWLHHCMVDRCLWLFQNNGGQWGGQPTYSPFQNLGGDTAQVASLGYTYSRGRPLGGRTRRRGRMSSIEVDALSANSTSGGTVGSAAARAAVKHALQQWTGNYTGYTWAVRFQSLDQHQMDKAVHIYVYLSRPGAPVQVMPSKVDDLNDLRLRPNYCGSVAGFNDHIHAADAQHILSRAVDITGCLQQAGLNPAVAPAQPEDPTRGPSNVPVKMADLKLVAVTADGEDVSSSFDFGKPVISWSMPVMRTAGQVRAVGAADDIEQAAYNAPTVFAAEEEVFSLVRGDVL